MYDLIGNISFVFFIIGLIAAICVAFISSWKAHYKKVKVPKKRFIKAIYLIGAMSVISGIGFIVSTAIDSLPEFSVIRTLLMSIFCIGVYPILMIGVYIFDMKYYGYVESDHHKPDR
ncbi:hypothetical protein ACFLXQ_09095 [Chloroflexota bacterium]